MKLLVSGATVTVERWAEHPALGRMTQPRCRNNIVKMATSGMTWSADNNILNGFSPDDYMIMLNDIARYKNDLLAFVTAPDGAKKTSNGIVVSWEATCWLFNQWLPALHDRQHVPGNCCPRRRDA